MAISETKMQMVIANYFKSECDIDTSIRQAFEKGFRIGVKKGASMDRPQEWIPCSEELPEYRKTVLISTFWGVKTGFLDNTEAYGGFWEIIEDDATTALHNIYAWMPLPEPWKGVNDEIKISPYSAVVGEPIEATEGAKMATTMMKDIINKASKGATDE